MHNLNMKYSMFNIDEEEMQRTPTIVWIHQPPLHPYSIPSRMWLIRVLARMGHIKKIPQNLQSQQLQYGQPKQ